MADGSIWEKNKPQSKKIENKKTFFILSKLIYRKDTTSRGISEAYLKRI